MGRVIAEIKLEITKAFMANANLATAYGFAPGSIFENEFSKLSFENILFDIISYSIWLLEQLFDTHKKELNEIIEAKMPHRPSWYRTKAKAFQYGHDLIFDSDKYDNTGFSDEQIEQSKIVKYSAVTKNGGQLLIKIATENDGVLSPITAEQKISFDAYIDEIADCGVKYVVVNNQPDILLLTMQIFIDPLVLNAQGMNILTGKYTVQDAILQYMKELPFNGEIVLFELERKIKEVEGVNIPNIINAESQIYDSANAEYYPAMPITVKTVPDSGYFTIPNFDNVSYVV